MIICSQIKLSVGEVYGPESNPRFCLHQNDKPVKVFRFKVMKESSKEEYLKYILAEAGKQPDEPLYHNFYVISPD